MADYGYSPDPGATGEDGVSRLLSLLDVTGWHDDHWTARCPSHDDDGPSLSIRLEGGRILLHCFAGCDTKAILDAVGLNWGDLFLDGGAGPTRPRTKPELTE